MNAVTKMPKMVNGMNVDDLMTLISEVAKDPAKGMTTWHVATTWMGHDLQPLQDHRICHRRQARGTPLHLDVDEPVEIGGSTSANPQEYLLAALNACMQTASTWRNAVRGIVLETLEIENPRRHRYARVSSARSQRGAGLREPALHGPHQGQGIGEQFAEVHEAVMKTSPNFHNIAKPVALASTLVVVD